MKFAWLLFLLLPVSAMAADNMMINTEIKEFKFHKKPEIGMSFTPGKEPGVVISPPIWKSEVIPGYRVRFKRML
jgi:hypothetical protein